MPLAQVTAFAALVRAGPVRTGPGSERARLDLLEAHERTVRERIDALEGWLEIIHGKVATYRRHLVDGTAEGVWAPRA